MTIKLESIDNTLTELEKLRKALARNKTIHINTREEKDLIKATVYSWLKSYRINFSNSSTSDIFKNINNYYTKLLNLSDKRTPRRFYINLISSLKKELIAFRSEVIKNTQADNLDLSPQLIPDFSVLISDQKMIAIINKRWCEIENCIKYDSPLAATVMMGGLLESILIAKTNTIIDKSILFKQKATPIDAKTRKGKQLSEWMLKDYIDVLSQIKLITSPSAELGRIIRDYRNYIHPEKELRAGESIEIGDARLFWATTSSLIREILSRI